MSDLAVSVTGINKSFGSLRALSGVSLKVKRGAFFGLLGPNGAGKTTLIGILGGLVKADGGRALVEGYDVGRDSLTVRSLLGIVPQELVYDPFFTVAESLVFQSKYYGIHRNREWIDALLDVLQLRDKAGTNTRRLSGGMKRRLMIAQALVHKPSVIVLDEPTAGVDINLRLALWDFIRKLNADGHTIILTTHYLEEAEALCDEVALMNQGKVVACGKTGELLRRVHSALRVRIRIDGGTLPPTLRPARTEGNIVYFDAQSYNEVEPLLADLRKGGITIGEIAIKSPRLEDVFMQLMNG